MSDNDDDVSYDKEEEHVVSYKKENQEDVASYSGEEEDVVSCNEDVVSYKEEEQEEDGNDARKEPDVGLRPINNTLPSILVQACWETSYQEVFSEMQQWISTGDGEVQMVILLTWKTLNSLELNCTVETFVYDPDAEQSHRRVMR